MQDEDLLLAARSTLTTGRRSGIAPRRPLCLSLATSFSRSQFRSPTMRCTVLALLGLVFAVPAFAADVPPPTGDTIVAPDAKLELLFTRTAKINGGLTEGPAAAPDGSIYFSDIPLAQDKGLIMRFDPKTKKTTVFADNSYKSNGLAFDREGRLVACEGADEGGRCDPRWGVHTGKQAVVAEKNMGHP